MIYGIGIDVVEPHRVVRLLEKYGDRFAHRVFYVANRFAAKEAFSKAMGTGFRYPVTLQCISIVQDRRGKPGFEFHPRLQAMVDEEGIKGHHVTISDEKSLACACVVLEK